MRLAVLLLMAVGTIPASNTQTCPVSFEMVNPHHNAGRLRSAAHPYQWYFRVQYKNETDKKITGATFKAAFIDAVKDRHVMSRELLSERKVDAGKSTTVDWWDDDYIDQYGTSAVGEVWATKIAFADGSIWQDGGSGACKANSVDAKGSWSGR